MSHDKKSTSLTLALRILGAFLIVIAAAVLGALLGRLTAPDLLPAHLAETPDAPPDGQSNAKTPDDGEAATVEAPPAPPPIFLHLGIASDSQWDILDAEVSYAAGIGLHRYLIPAKLAWSEGEDLSSTIDAMTRIAGLDPEATFVLQLDFNPPAAWFDAHPDVRMAGTVGETPYPSPSSEIWLNAARSAFDRLLAQLSGSEWGARVNGYALYGLVLGAWQRGPDIDTTEANLAAFRAWLARAYRDDATLQKAWGQSQAILNDAALPAAESAEITPAIFYALEKDQPLLDYRRFAAESVADAIGALSAHIREKTNAQTAIWANYGHTFEKGRASDGHLALTALLDSDVDGFLSPVSMLNRGIGATGGFMGPVNSAKAHGKTWVLVDDTRTGIAWNPETGQIEQMRGLRAEDVHNVQRRNFALAALYGLTLVWSDPEGQGFFHDDTQWEVFGQLYGIYERIGDTSEADPASPPPADTPFGIPAKPRHPMVQVIVDEYAQFLTRPQSGLDTLLHANRDAVMQSGASTAFFLLDDLIDGRTLPSPVYLLLNAYHLKASEVAALHARFAEEKATAIWVFAPGYLDVTMNKNNVRDTVGMNIREFDEPSPGGSTYSLTGSPWIDEGQVFGEARLLQPLFFIDEPEADVLATFQQTQKPSVAIRTMEAGWTSVFVAEPRLSAPLMRELLHILEQPLYFRPGKERFFDLAVMNSRLLAIHAEESGERIVNVGDFYDIVDLFDASIGWPQKESFILDFKKGETRLFELTLP